MMTQAPFHNLGTSFWDMKASKVSPSIEPMILASVITFLRLIVLRIETRFPRLLGRLPCARLPVLARARIGHRPFVPASHITQPTSRHDSIQQPFLGSLVAQHLIGLVFAEFGVWGQSHQFPDIV